MNLAWGIIPEGERFRTIIDSGKNPYSCGLTARHTEESFIIGIEAKLCSSVVGQVNGEIAHIFSSLEIGHRWRVRSAPACVRAWYMVILSYGSTTKVQRILFVNGQTEYYKESFSHLLPSQEKTLYL